MQMQHKTKSLFVHQYSAAREIPKATWIEMHAEFLFATILFGKLNRGWKRNHLTFDIPDSCLFYSNDS